MKIVSVWNPKGGQGKSMLTMNLAAAALEIGFKPIVIDGDKQGTSMAFFGGGNLPFSVIPEIPNEAPEGDFIVIDHQATDWEIPTPSVIVMPVIPERTQLITYFDAYKLAEQAGKRIITVMTGGDERRQKVKAIVDEFRRRGAFVLPASSAFVTAADELQTIFDPSLNRVYGINERRSDVRAILSAVLQNHETKGE